MTNQQRVRNILEFVPATRSSDTELLLVYWQKAGLDLTPEQVQKIKDMPTPDTLTRIRRKIQEGGEYPATKQAEESRYNKFKNVKQNINNEDAEKLLASKGYKILPYAQDYTQ